MRNEKNINSNVYLTEIHIKIFAKIICEKNKNYAFVINLNIS